MIEQLKQDVVHRGSTATASQLQLKCKHLFVLSLSLGNHAHLSNADLPSVVRRIVELVDLFAQYHNSLDFEIRFPIQERFYACLFHLLERCTAQREAFQIETYPMQLKVSIFTHMFSGLSSGFKILTTLSKQMIRNLARSYRLVDEETIQLDSELATLLLEQDNQFFFSNLFAKMRFFEGTCINQGCSARHLLHVLKSLTKLCPKMLRTRLVGILDLLCDNMDSALIRQDQTWTLLVIDMVLIMTEFINQHQEQIGRSLPESVETVTLKKMVVQETATFGAGCYRGVEKQICEWASKNLVKGAILGTQVGFMSSETSID